MKRDLELVRAILLRVEQSEGHSVRAADFASAGYDERTVARHFLLMKEAGLIEANLLTTERYGVLHGTAERLTWSGHEFLDATRNETVWQRTKEVVKEKGGSVPFEVLQSLVIQMSAMWLGLR